MRILYVLGRLSSRFLLIGVDGMSWISMVITPQGVVGALWTSPLWGVPFPLSLNAHTHPGNFRENLVINKHSRTSKRTRITIIYTTYGPTLLTRRSHCQITLFMVPIVIILIKV